MDEFKPVPILGPSIPFQGLNAATPGPYLTLGKASDIANLRSVLGAVQVRLPLTTTNKALVVASASFRGCYECLFEGVPTIFVACVVSAKTRVYKSVDSGANFTEITTASGPYGETRMSDNGLVEFQVVRDRPPLTFEAYDCLIIQNNTDSPRIYAKAVTGSTAFTPGAYGMAIISQPATIGGAWPTFFIQEQIQNYFTTDTANTSYSSTGAGMVAADSTSDPNNSIGVTVTALFAAGTCTVIFALAVDFSNISAFITLVRSDTSGFWDNVQIEIGDGTNFDILTPAFRDTVDGPDTLPAVYTTPDDLVYSQYLLTVPSSTTVDYSVCDRLRFTWQDVAPAGTIFGDMLLFGRQGDLPVAAGYALGYYGTDQRSLGPETIFPVLGTPNAYTSGGPKNLSTVLLSTNNVFLYHFSLWGPNTTDALRDKGIDRWFVFRQDVGQTDFFLVGSKRMASWGGASWTFDSGSAGTSVFIGTSSTGSFGGTSDISWPALDTGFVVAPTGRPMCSTTSRFFVGSGNRMWYSGDERPFQFRQYILPDNQAGLSTTSPGSFGIDGENICQLLSIGSLSAGNEAIGSPSNGVSTIFVFTDRTVSWVTGWDSTSLNKRNLMYSKGTYSPKSVAPSRTGFFFLDTDRQPVEVDGYTVSKIGRDVVDTITANIPDSRIGWVWGVVRNDRYYMPYTPSGSTNTKCLIYDVHESERQSQRVWLSDTFPVAVSGVSGLLSYRNGSVTQLVGFDSVCQCLEHETKGATSDAGVSGVAWSINLPEVNAGLLNPVRVRRMGVVCDASMGTITSGRTTEGRETQVTSSGTISTNSMPGPRAVRWDMSSDGQNPGTASSSIMPSLSGTSDSLKTIYGVFIEIGPTQGGGADVG